MAGLLALVAVTAVGVAMTRRGRENVAAAAVLVATLSLSASTLAGGGRAPVFLLTEGVAMVVLIFLLVRHAAAPQAVAAGLLVALAAAVMILVEAPAEDSLREAAGGVAFWTLFALGAAGAALHLNTLDVRRARSIASARRSQRLELARDLHDFVAHDVSAIVVTAQAGQVVAPQEAVAALQRIEEDGLRALAAMDRTVQALRDATEASGPAAGQAPVRRHTLDDLRDLTDRFATAGSVDVYLEIEPDAVRGLPPDVTATGYRVAVEALTNVRRHAHGATRVEVVVSRLHVPRDSALLLTVTDNGMAAPGRTLQERECDGGLGLLGMRERVEALGGTVSAGPRHQGWRVRLVLPHTNGSP